jgi:hypothetical protein
MQRRWRAELTQALGKQHALRWVVTEQQGVLHIEALGLGALQALIQLGTGQVIGNRRCAQ